MSTHLLTNHLLWRDLRQAVKSTRVVAAIAYFGTRGAKLLPLKKGDVLVVDMNLATVRQGATNPTEIQNLVRRGVLVFWRPRLHAKMLVAGRRLFVGSANVSLRSQSTLDEAALVTSDRAAVERAKRFIRHMCVQPVTAKYLAACRKAYRPPRMPQMAEASQTKVKRVPGETLWLVGGLRYGTIPASEEPAATERERAAKKRFKTHAELDYVHYPFPVRWFQDAQTGDQVVQMIRDRKGSVDVHAPETS